MYMYEGSKYIRGVCTSARQSRMKNCSLRLSSLVRGHKVTRRRGPNVARATTAVDLLHYSPFHFICIQNERYIYDDDSACACIGRTNSPIDIRMNI